MVVFCLENASMHLYSQAFEAGSEKGHQSRMSVTAGQPVPVKVGLQ
jgi:hypothetical protein